MTLQVNEKYKIIGKVDSLNSGDHFSNVTIITKDKTLINIKTNKELHNLLTIGKVYVFSCLAVLKSEEEIVLSLTNLELADDVLSAKEIQEYMPIFYNYAPVKLADMKEYIDNVINHIQNVNIKNIVVDVFKNYEDQFYLHPAATKFHHAYLGGLAYHTYQMLKLTKGYIEVYPFLNKDLLYAGVLLHDIAKIKEITGVDGEYTKEGLLLGHLVLGVLDIEKSALKLGIENSEEAILLKHLIISHHGQLNFGSAKKPMTAEALVLSLVDMADAKLTVLGETLEVTEKEAFTTNIAVLDKMRFYNPNIEE